MYAIFRERFAGTLAVTCVCTHTGHYRCRLTQLSTPSLAALASTLQSQLAVRARVAPRDGQTAVTSQDIVLPFTPAFYVQTAEILLSNEMLQSKLRISGTREVLQNLKVRCVSVLCSRRCHLKTCSCCTCVYVHVLVRR